MTWRALVHYVWTGGRGEHRGDGPGRRANMSVRIRLAGCPVDPRIIFLKYLAGQSKVVVLLQSLSRRARKQRACPRCTLFRPQRPNEDDGRLSAPAASAAAPRRRRRARGPHPAAAAAVAQQDRDPWGEEYRRPRWRRGCRQRVVRAPAVHYRPSPSLLTPRKPRALAVVRSGLGNVCAPSARRRLPAVCSCGGGVVVCKQVNSLLEPNIILVEGPSAFDSGVRGGGDDADAVRARSLHSSTSQLNLRRVWSLVTGKHRNHPAYPTKGA